MGVIARIFGFLVRIKGETVSSLQDLISRQNVTEYAGFMLNQRRVSGSTLGSDLGRICGLKCYPALASHDFSWLPALMAELPQDDEEQMRERKDRRWVRYDVLAQVPDQIRKEAVALPSLPDRQKAQMARDALLIAWLTTLPWRQLNIRECKLMPFAEGGNLWKEEISPRSQMAKSPEVEQALRENPRERFWQFHFRTGETKTKHAVRAILPRQLVPLLEEYLEYHRGILLGGKDDPHTVFLGDRGRPLGQHGVIRLVGGITIKYAGRRVNPHLFRDLFAVQWLEEHPEDYLTLSKILWHSNINTTIRIYGRNFDESHGARRVEQWLDARTNATEHLKDRAPNPSRRRGEKGEYLSGFICPFESNTA
jgi:hypothetical protein